MSTAEARTVRPYVDGAWRSTGTELGVPDPTDTAEVRPMRSVEYGGQRCSAVSRVLAHEAVHDEKVELTGTHLSSVRTADLFDESTTFGPLIFADQAERVEGLVDDAVDRGAELVRGGDREAAFVEPTLPVDVPQDAWTVHEEPFGSVAAVTVSEDETVWVADQIDDGAVRIDGRPSDGIGDVSHGGNKDSGIGREALHRTIEAMVRTKSIIL